MVRLVFFLWMLTTSTVQAQSFSLTGQVLDSITNKPMAGASVYLANTTFGITTDEKGWFNLIGIPSGSYQIGISYIGYETITQSIHFDKNDQLTIRMKHQSQTLEEVVIANTKKVKKRTLSKWKKIFFEQVIGVSPFAETCSIQNEEALRFKYTEADKILTAYATEPLLINNPALGYQITYYLEHFIYNDSGKVMTYSGKPVYKSMQGTVNELKKWKHKRKEAYDLSLLKFMRAVYHQDLGEHYFLFKPTGGIETARFKELLISTFKIPERSEHTKAPSTVAFGFNSNGSVNKDYIVDGVSRIKVDSIPIQLKDICYKTDSATVVLKFRGSLIIEQWEKGFNYDSLRLRNDFGYSVSNKLLPAYRLMIHRLQGSPSGYPGLMAFPTAYSGIYITAPGTIEIKENGYFSTNLAAFGIMGWTEKLGTMLPLDYWPEKM